MTPEELTHALAAAAGDNLDAVVLYGSAAAGDAGKGSDANVLVTLNRMEPADLLALTPVSARWTRAGNPPPLLFTRERLKRSLDVFPVELADLLESRKVLRGTDPFPGLEIRRDALRFQVEHELKSVLIRLREGFLVSGGKAGPVRGLMASSVSSVTALCRAALRLYRDGPPPARKAEALAELARHVSFDLEALRLAREIKDGRAAGADPIDAFSRYVRAVETVADAVDGWTHKNGG